MHSRNPGRHFRQPRKTSLYTIKVPCLTSACLSHAMLKFLSKWLVLFWSLGVYTHMITHVYIWNIDHSHTMMWLTSVESRQGNLVMPKKYEPLRNSDRCCLFGWIRNGNHSLSTVGFPNQGCSASMLLGLEDSCRITLFSQLGSSLFLSKCRLLIPAVFMATWSNLIVFRMAKWKFNAKVPDLEDGETASMSRKYMHFSLGVLLIFQSLGKTEKDTQFSRDRCNSLRESYWN